MRPSKVIYDRAHSAIAEADPCDFDFDAIILSGGDLAFRETYFVAVLSH